MQRDMGIALSSRVSAGSGHPLLVLQNTEFDFILLHLILPFPGCCPGTEQQQVLLGAGGDTAAPGCGTGSDSPREAVWAAGAP